MSSTETGAAVFEERYEVGADAARVFGALTDRDELKAWFCEHAEVEARVGGAFRFWGRHTAYGVEASGATQTITAFEPGRRVAFDWAWGGAATRVDLLIEPAGARCTLAVRHEADDAPGGQRACVTSHVLEDFWIVAAGNLREYLAHGKPALRTDHGPDGGDVTLSIEVRAPVETVWRSLTDPSEMDVWLSEAARIDPRAGGEYSYGWESDGSACGPTKLLEFEPPHRMVHDWTHTGDQTGRTEWTLEAVGSGTLVTVRQFKTGSAREFSGYTDGWAAFLHGLRARFETG